MRSWPRWSAGARESWPRIRTGIVTSEKDGDVMPRRRPAPWSLRLRVLRFLVVPSVSGGLLGFGIAAGVRLLPRPFGVAVLLAVCAGIAGLGFWMLRQVRDVAARMQAILARFDAELAQESGITPEELAARFEQQGCDPGDGAEIVCLGGDLGRLLPARLVRSHRRVVRKIRRRNSGRVSGDER